MAEKKAFLGKPKHQYHVSHWRERVYTGQWQKEWKLLGVSMFVSTKGWTSILRQMAEKKLFFGNQSIKILYPNKKKVVYGGHHKKNVDHYKNQCLSYLMDEL